MEPNNDTKEKEQINNEKERERTFLVLSLTQLIKKIRIVDEEIKRWKLEKIRLEKRLRRGKHIYQDKYI